MDVLVHGIHMGEISRAEEEHLCAHSDRHIQTPRLVNIALRLFGNFHFGLLGGVETKKKMRNR